VGGGVLLGGFWGSRGGGVREGGRVFRVLLGWRLPDYGWGVGGRGEVVCRWVRELGFGEGRLVE
jgi:hypothetical protein